MVRRTVALLALLLPLATASASSAGQAPPLPTVTIDLVCPADELVVTIDNQTIVDYEVTVEMGPDGQPPTSSQVVTVESGTTEEVVLPVTDSPAAVVVTGDGDFPPTSFSPVFGCPTVLDFDVTTPEGTPIDVDLGAPCFAGTETANGSVEQVDNFTVRYTPDPGFVGVDTFDYECTGSANQLGTVTVTVTPAQVPAEPVPEEPTFTG